MNSLPRKARQHLDKSECVLPWCASPRLNTDPWYPSSGCVREVVGNRKSISVKTFRVKVPFPKAFSLPRNEGSFCRPILRDQAPG